MTDRSTGKIDFKKTLDCYRATHGRFRVLDVPDGQYLMVDGHGDPNTSAAYADALAALYPVAYRLKFFSKLQLGRDYVVPPLEGLWSADDMAAFTVARDKSRWDWTMMLMVPDWLGAPEFQPAQRELATKQPAPARLSDVRLNALSEGRCVQTLHVGPFDDEGPLLAQLHEEFIPAHGLRLTGRHHEIYLSDPRRTPPTSCAPSCDNQYSPTDRRDPKYVTRRDRSSPQSNCASE